MSKKVRLRKQGKFYASYEDDAYVISAIMGYKYSNGKIGFPLESLGKVTSKLEEKKVNYVIIENNEEKESMKYSPKFTIYI